MLHLLTWTVLSKKLAIATFCSLILSEKTLSYNEDYHCTAGYGLVQSASLKRQSRELKLIELPSYFNTPGKKN